MLIHSSYVLFSNIVYAPVIHVSHNKQLMITYPLYLQIGYSICITVLKKCDRTDNQNRRHIIKSYLIKLIIEAS